MKKILARYTKPPAATKSAVESVSQEALCRALEPLMDLLGTSLDALMTGSLHIDGHSVRYVTCEPVRNAQPVRWGRDTESEASIWAWQVYTEVVFDYEFRYRVLAGDEDF